MARSFVSGNAIKTTLSIPNTQGALSGSAWVFPTVSATQAILGSSINGGQEFRLDVTTNILHLLSQNTAGIVQSAGAVSLNAWTHVGFSYDGTTSRLYIAGLPDGVAAAGNPTQATAILWIGNAVNGEAYTGSIADAAVWNGTLTAAEFAALAKGARPRSIRPQLLFAWLPLGGIQSPEPDLSGNANNGTLTGTAPDFGPPLLQFTPRWNQFLTPPAGATVFPYPPFQLKAA